MSTFAERLIGAARLDAGTFEEVEADRSGTGQALAVVVLSSIAGGISTASVGGLGLRSLAVGTLASLVGWIAWATLVYILGTRIFGEPQTKADVGELLRTVGFASTPGLLRVVGVVPGLGWFVYLVTLIWILAAMVVGVRQALDFTTTSRALAVCAASLLLSLIIVAVIGILFPPTVQ